MMALDERLVCLLEAIQEEWNEAVEAVEQDGALVVRVKRALNPANLAEFVEHRRAKKDLPAAVPVPTA